MTHASDDAIQHLKSNAERMKIAQGVENKIPKTNECEPCALAKMHRMISRSSDNAKSSDRPFFRITYDLMQMPPALNRDE